VVFGDADLPFDKLRTIAGLPFDKLRTIAGLPFDKLRTSAGLPFDFAQRRCRFLAVCKNRLWLFWRFVKGNDYNEF